MIKVSDPGKPPSAATLEVLRIRLAVTVALYVRHNDRVAAALKKTAASWPALDRR
jgi:hypothetical protein